MKETKNTLPMDFSVVSQPYTVLNHLNTVKEMSKEAVCLSDELFEQINKEYKVFQERTIENSPVMFHGWEVDVDPEDGNVFATRIIGDVEGCKIVLVANGHNNENGHFHQDDDEDESYIYLYVTSDTEVNDLTATLTHELTHYFDYKEGRIQPVDDLVVYLKNENLHDNDILKIYGDAMYVLWSPTEIRAFTSTLFIQSKEYTVYQREVRQQLKDFCDQINDFVYHFGGDLYEKQHQALDDCFMDKSGILPWLKTPGGFVYMSERYALPAIALAKETVLAQLGSVA